MYNVFSLIEKTAEIGYILLHIDLRGLGIRTICHGLIELIKGNGPAQIIGIRNPIQFIMEADIGNISALKMLGA